MMMPLTGSSPLTKKVRLSTSSQASSGPVNVNYFDESECASPVISIADSEGCGGMTSTCLNTKNDRNTLSSGTVDQKFPFEGAMILRNEINTSPYESSSEVQSSCLELSPVSNTNNFTQEEDEIILKGFAKFGAKWDDIVQWGSLNRTGSQVKGRFHRMIKNQIEKNQGTDKIIVSPISMPSALPFSVGSPVSVNNSLGQVTCSTNSGIISPSESVGVPASSATGIKPVEGPSQQTSELQDCFPERFSIDGKLHVYRHRIKSLEKVLEKEQRQRLDLEKQNLELINLLNSLKNEACFIQKAYEREISNLRESNGIKMEKISSIFRNLLTEKAIQDAKKVRQKLNEDCLRLASSRYERVGSEFKEHIQEGSAFTELYIKQARIMEEKTEIDGRRRDILKRKNNIVSNESGSGMDDRTMRELLEEEEVLKVRYASLKKQEADLLVQHENLLREKETHLRDLRRVRDENASRFHSHPVIGGRYLLLHLIGKGGFSEVYLAYDLQEFMEVACKIHQLSSSWCDSKKSNYMKHAIREYSIHKDLCHPRIIRLLDVFEIDEHSFCTVLEYNNGSDLEMMLQVHSTFSEREARCIIIQVISALKYLNELDPPVIHYDLKPANILFYRGEVRITDFGLSKLMEHRLEDNTLGTELTSQGAGTYWYLPPECFGSRNSERPIVITSKVDVWSVGVILYQLLYGKKPFGNDLSQQDIVAQKTIQNAYKVHFPSRPTISNECKAFISKCLEYDQKKRPDVLRLCTDQFIQAKTTKNNAHSTIP